jgi:hypothetical protein
MNMEDTLMNEEFLAEARRIGDELLEKAKRDSVGTYWETMTMDMERNMSFTISDGIYGGTSGIALFMMELYKKTDDPKYRDAAVEGMKWVDDYNQKNPANYFALITGRMGASYAMIRMHQHTGDAAYLEKALEIAKPAAGIKQSQQMIDDLINGTSGTLLGFLHLHAATGEPWVLEAVNRHIEHLLMSAQQGPKGLYWDRSNNAIDGLCGYSHGAAGIGFVFLEAGRYLKNEALYHVAEQAFLYERHYFDAEKKNWPDLRKGIYTDDDRKDHEGAFLAGNMAYFTTPGDMNAWCHGAAGIGLSRLRAYQLLGKAVYRKEAEIAIEKTTRTDVENTADIASYILCHGGGGNSDLFIEAYRLWGDKSYLEKARTVAGKILASHKIHGRYLSGFRHNNTEEDTSLFMGNAGIGYFMLRLVDPHGVPSLVTLPLDDDKKVTKAAPGTDLSSYPFISIDEAELQRKLQESLFHRTLYVAERLIPDEMQTYYKENPFSIKGDDTMKAAFTGYMEKIIPTLPKAKQDLMADIFRLELEKMRMDEAVQSHSYINIKDIVNSERGQAVLERFGMDKDGENGDIEAFKGLTLQMDADIKLDTFRWKWPLFNREQWEKNIEEGMTAEPEEEPEDDWAVLLRPIPLKILEVELSPFSYTILEELFEPNTVEHVIKSTIDAFESLTPEQETILEGKIIEQIRQVLMSGILHEPADKTS